jgi:WD40 repeat protein
MVANSTPLITLHVCSTASRVHNSIASRTTNHCIALHFHPHTMSWHAWAGMVLHSYGTQFYRRLGQPFGEKDGENLYCVKFSRDGKYLAYGGPDEIIILWTVKNIAPELPVSAIPHVQGDRLTRFSTPVSITVFPQRQSSHI